MTRRYFVPDLPLRGGLVTLSGAEAQHAIRVMRVQSGQEITLFDGKGHESAASVLAVDKKSCQCEAAAAEAIDRESSRALRMGVALPKPDRARELIERLTELGVETVVPLVAARTQRPPSPSMMEKLRRAVIEASKQCGRNQLMMLQAPLSAAEFFRDHDRLVPSGEDRAGAERIASRWIAHPGGEPLAELAARATSPVVVAIGPEGGWTEDELDIACHSGFLPIDLGKRIYRIETAATAIAAALAD